MFLPRIGGLSSNFEPATGINVLKARQKRANLFTMEDAHLEIVLSVSKQSDLKYLIIFTPESAINSSFTITTESNGPGSVIPSGGGGVIYQPGARQTYSNDVNYSPTGYFRIEIDN